MKNKISSSIIVGAVAIATTFLVSGTAQAGPHNSDVIIHDSYRINSYTVNEVYHEPAWRDGSHQVRSPHGDYPILEYGNGHVNYGYTQPRGHLVPTHNVVRRHHRAVRRNHASRTVVNIRLFNSHDPGH